MNLYRTKKVQDVSEVDYEDLFEAAYWRKFNALHNWFVNNVQNGVDDCGTYFVSEDQFNTLCKLLKSLTPENCHELLPTRPGFFFGNTDYDESYWEKVKDSITELNYLLNYINWDKESLIYTSSW